MDRPHKMEKGVGGKSRRKEKGVFPRRYSTYKKSEGREKLGAFNAGGNSLSMPGRGAAADDGSLVLGLCRRPLFCLPHSRFFLHARATKRRQSAKVLFFSAELTKLFSIICSTDIHCFKFGFNALPMCVLAAPPLV